MSVIYQIVCTFRGKSIGGVEKFHKFQNSKFQISKIQKFQKNPKFQNILKINKLKKIKTGAKPLNRGGAPKQGAGAEPHVTRMKGAKLPEILVIKIYNAFVCLCVCLSFTEMSHVVT